MNRLIAFNFITLDGYFEGPDSDTSWALHGQEEGDYAVQQVKTDSILLFGRVTYGHMVSWWPTEAAKSASPDLAAGMNASEKIVFSRTLKNSDWHNTRVVADPVAEVQRLKQNGNKDLAIMGSSSIVTQFTDLGLIDEYQFLINPVALGRGVSVFHDIKQQLRLRLVHSQVFKSGVILVHYQREGE